MIIWTFPETNWINFIWITHFNYTNYFVLYPQNGDRIVNIDYVTSVHPMYWLNVWVSVLLLHTLPLSLVYLQIIILRSFRVECNDLSLSPKVEIFGAPMSPGECASIRSPGNCRFLTIRTAYRLIILYCSFCCGDVAKSALLYKTEKCAKSHACHGTLYALLVDDSLGCGAWRYVRRSLTSSHRGVCTFSERS